MHGFGFREHSLGFRAYRVEGVQHRLRIQGSELSRGARNLARNVGLWRIR